MKKGIAVSSSAVLAFAMLLPVARQVNAASVYQPVFAQGGKLPTPPGPGGFQGGKLPTPPGPGGFQAGK